jgi:hypothetical protein
VKLAGPIITISTTQIVTRTILTTKNLALKNPNNFPKSPVIYTVTTLSNQTKNSSDILAVITKTIFKTESKPTLTNSSNFDHVGFSFITLEKSAYRLHKYNMIHTHPINMAYFNFATMKHTPETER